MISLGIDIGTTSVCVVCYDSSTGKIVERDSVPNCFIEEETGYTQDPEKIAASVENMLSRMEGYGKQVSCVGITSQMHGIVYVNGQGEAVSPLYTWKNEYGNKVFRDRMTYAEYLTRETGYPLYSGYGSVTHFYLQKQKQIPAEAVFFVSIGDYVGMKLTGKKTCKVHKTMAASFGVYRLTENEFDHKKLLTAGVDPSFYPEITEGEAVGSLFFQGSEIPVYCAIGDNQASFHGAVEDRYQTIGINVGTGSQVSVYAGSFTEAEGAEVRPYCTDGYLYVGASLNGGKVYEKLADFYAEIGTAFTGKKVEAYEVMHALAADKPQTTLKTVPNFYGQRGASGAMAEISHMTADNFHPADLVRSFVVGMADELYGLYEGFPEAVKKGKISMIASGNGLRKNRLLAEEVEKRFGMKLQYSETEEEAAAGAASYAAAAMGDCICRL